MGKIGKEKGKKIGKRNKKNAGEVTSVRKSKRLFDIQLVQQ